MTVIRLEAADQRCGPKAAHLATIMRAGFNVPDGFVVLNGVPAAARLQAELDRLGGGPVAVRSSALVEDTPSASFAGQFLTVLGVTGAPAVAAAIEQCAHPGHPIGQVYGHAGGTASGPIPVIVQQLVAAEVSGVMFTQDPVSGVGHTVINATWGLAEPLVQGAITPDTYYVDGNDVTTVPGSKHLRHDHETGRIVLSETDPALRDRLCLTSTQARNLARAGRDLELLFGTPQDAEWVLTGNTLWIVQTRPITTATAQASALPRHREPPLLHGVGASRGRVTGPVRVLHGPEDFPSVGPGDIVVCQATDPAWTPLFRVAGGIITENGGILCHAAILAREVAIPAVVGAPGASTSLATGDVVTVDGTAGNVTRAVVDDQGQHASPQNRPPSTSPEGPTSAQSY
jgi:pyruvate, water dikinase